MNEDGIAEIELALYLFFLSLSIVSFCKIDKHLKTEEQRELHDFKREWDKFTSRNIQRVYTKEE